MLLIRKDADFEEETLWMHLLTINMMHLKDITTSIQYVYKILEDKCKSHFIAFLFNKNQYLQRKFQDVEMMDEEEKESYVNMVLQLPNKEIFNHSDTISSLSSKSFTADAVTFKSPPMFFRTRPLT